MQDFTVFSSSGRRDRIVGCNFGNTDMEAGFPVRLLGLARSVGENEYPGRVPWNIAPVDKSTTFIGVTLSEIGVNQCGEVLIDGIAPCRIEYRRGIYPDHAIAGDGFLEASDYGWPFFPSGDDGNGFILLGGRYSAFYGAFAVIRRGEGFFCCDSLDMESGIAGSSDLGDVPSGIIEADGGHFYLFAWYDNGHFHQSFSRPSGVPYYGLVCLADLIDGEAHQRWTQGFIHWAQWYIL